MWAESQTWKQAEAGVAWEAGAGTQEQRDQATADACPQPVSEYLRLCLKFTFQASIWPFLDHVPAILLVEEEGKSFRRGRLEGSHQLV